MPGTLCDTVQLHEQQTIQTHGEAAASASMVQQCHLSPF